MATLGAVWFLPWERLAVNGIPGTNMARQLSSFFCGEGRLVAWPLGRDPLNFLLPPIFPALWPLGFERERAVAAQRP